MLRIGCAALAAWALAAGWPAGVAAATGSGAPTSTPSDPAFRAHEQWGLVQAGFPAAWCRSTGAGALIVVIDTGLNAAHPDLSGKVVGEASVRDGTLTVGSGSAADDSGHGTHVAGIAAAATDNGVGVAGAAPAAKLFAIKVLWPSSGGAESGSRSDLVQAIDYATTRLAPEWPGPVVLNVSIGAADAPGTASDSLSDGGASGDVDGALARAYQAGLGLAVAAGNAGTTGVGATAVAAGEALSVGALDQNGSVAPYSPTSGVSIFAAGGAAGAGGRYTGTGILSTWLHAAAGDYAWMAGTSMAAPHVAAALALLMSTGMSNQVAYARLLSTMDAQRRMHVDTAVGSTGPCGAAAPATGASQSVRATVVAPATHSAAAPVASPSPSPSVAPVALPATGVPTAPAAAPVASGGHPWLGRLALLLGAVVVLWWLTPRRLLRRLLST